MLGQAVFGFDFDFNPVCHIQHTTFLKDYFMEQGLGGSWDLIARDESALTLRREYSPDLIRLKGHRLFGLRVDLSITRSYLHTVCDEFAIRIWYVTLGNQRIWRCSIY